MPVPWRCAMLARGTRTTGAWPVRNRRMTVPADVRRHSVMRTGPMPCQPGWKGRTDGGRGGRGDAMEVGWSCFIENVHGAPCLQGRPPRFFSRPSHIGGHSPRWRGAGTTIRSLPIVFTLPRPGTVMARRYATDTRAPCSRPVHICLDSGGGQAIVVPFRGQLAQMDRALASGAKGHRFESCIAHHATDTGRPDDLHDRGAPRLCCSGPDFSSFLPVFFRVPPSSGKK